MEKLDWWAFVLLHRIELDEMLRHRDYICGACGLAKDNHRGDCIVYRLLRVRERMVPMIIINEKGVRYNVR